MKGLLVLLGALVLSVEHATAQDTECAGSPEPVVTLSYVSRYVQDDAARSTIDPLREAEAEAAVAPVDEFISALARSVDAMYSGSPRDREMMASCVLNQIDDWAQADALSHLDTETVRLTVGARYAGFAMIVWQTLPYAHDHPARDRILDWLDRRMREQVVFWKDAAVGARQGNLRAWAGLAAAAVAVQTDDAELMDWAEVAIADVMCSANADGSLPQEMARGKLALHYQLHAIAPLVTAVAILERQGVPASRDFNGALQRIVDFAVSDLGWTPQEKSLPVISRILKPGSRALSLVKPQYEAPMDWLTGGVLPEERIPEVLDTVRLNLPEELVILGEARSPIIGAGGNAEYWLWVKKIPA